MNTLLLSLALCARAQAPAVSTAPVVAASSAPAVAASSRPATASEILDKIKALDASLTTLQADFHQSLETGAGLKQEQSGRLFYDKPDHIRLEFDAPRRQVTVSDKKVLWIYQPDDKQVIKADWEDWKKGQQGLSGLLDFGQYSQLLDKHDATVEPYAVEGSSAPVPGSWRLTLKPKSSAAYTLVLVVSAPDYFPKRTELEMERMKIVSELKDVQVNPKLDAKLFEFKPPAGLPVIQLATP